MGLLVAVNALFFLFLGSLWERDHLVNVCIKLALWLLCFANAFEMLKLSGYVVKVGGA